MRPRRPEVTSALLYLWNHPACRDMRFGQLIMNILRWNDRDIHSDIWEITDEEWVGMIANALREAHRLQDSYESGAIE